MVNAMWLLISVVVYSGIWIFLKKKIKNEKFQEKFKNGNIKQIAIITLLCLPLSFSGTVVSVLGSGQGKNVISFFSLYQKAENNAFSIFGGGFQQAGNSAQTCIGITGYQQSENDAAVFAGISGYQQAGNNAALGVGITGYQKAGNDALMVAGVAGYQQTGLDVVTLMGITGYQQAGNSALTGLGITGCQKVPNKTRSFVVWSKLKKHE